MSALEMTTLITPATQTVRFRGQDVTLRPLTIADSIAVERQAPLPDHELEPDVTASGARHREAEAAAARARHRLVTLGACMDIAASSGEPWTRERSPEWAAQYADEIAGSITQDEALLILERLAQLADPERAGEITEPTAAPDATHTEL
jgi:hypothetical protein